MVYNRNMDSLAKRRHNRACTYKAVKPYLSKPMPAIELKYFQAPSKEDRLRMAKEGGMICDSCGRAISVVGSTNTITGEMTCEDCAIEHYRKSEGFKTRRAAEAHRRRLFDTGYLLTETVFDMYLDKHGLEDEVELSNAERKELFELGVRLQKMIPPRKLTELHHTIDQAKIERYYRRLIDQNVEFPAKRFA